jgi:DNA polymerase elongation subunit (family B)
VSSRPAPPHLSCLADVSQSPGQIFTTYAYLHGKREGQTRDGRPFIDLHLSDTTAALAGKIWDDAPGALDAARQLVRGSAVKVLFETRTFQGKLQLGVQKIREIEADDPGFDKSLVYGEGYELIEDIRCDTLVFDIETVPDTDLRKAPSTIAQAVAKWAERGETEEAKVMSLSPLFGKVVSLALGEGEGPLEDQKITTLIVPPAGREDDEFPPDVRAMSEPDLLRAFWALAQHAEVVVTYNGRGFDIPFLITRSLINGIPARIDLLSRPFDIRPHLDLHQVLTTGNRRLGPSSLDVVCWALGIRSPKGEMDGSMVAPFYAQGDIETIAVYNAGDVAATSAVYQHVRDHVLRFREDWNVG